MADGVGQVGAVQRVEMEPVDARRLQAAHLLAGEHRGDHAPRLRIFVESLEGAGESRRNAGAALAREAGDAGEVRHRHDAGHQRHGDAGCRHLVAKAQEDRVVEEELRNGPCRAGIDLALEIVEVSSGAGGLRMGLRIGRDGELEWRDSQKAGDEVACPGIAAGRRPVAPGAVRRIAAQGDDMADAGLPVPARDIVDLVARGRDAGEMRGTGEASLACDAADRGVGAFARRAAGAIGDRREGRAEWRQPLDGGPELRLGGLRLRRKKTRS